ncbi:ABC transporter ATP-binding protein [Bryobacter aggregatus]|uniref:ABC transporter ATP-binding protein n=1 Tax=Bryobacter aggregatus TaxID=360054 RepID=UPI000691650C|nr:ATP-binding cassette domain-containing protein [Bryobacter aggregatus]
MIQVEGLTKRYARNVAVDHVSFSVERGQIVGFLGPNGAGKTTTMRMLTCFMPPSEGTATVAGFDIVKQPLEVKKRIGYLPETPPVYPEMEVGEYLQFVARIKGIPEKEVLKRSQEAAARCSVKDVWSKLIGKLSKGYRQRVGLAQAIIHNPDVLILDEPTSGFDPKQILETRDLIKSLAGEHTIVLSTHILQEVEAMCESLVIINKGKIAKSGSVEELTRRNGALLEVTVPAGAADSALLTAPFAHLAGVSGAQASPLEQGLWRIEVDTANDADIRPQLAQIALSQGWNLYRLDSTSVNLHELFLSLTSPVAASALTVSAPEVTEQ